MMTDEEYLEFLKKQGVKDPDKRHEMLIEANKEVSRDKLNKSLYWILGITLSLLFIGFLYLSATTETKTCEDRATTRDDYYYCEMQKDLDSLELDPPSI